MHRQHRSAHSHYIVHGYWLWHVLSHVLQFSAIWLSLPNTWIIAGGIPISVDNNFAVTFSNDFAVTFSNDFAVTFSNDFAVICPMKLWQRRVVERRTLHRTSPGSDAFCWHFEALAILLSRFNSSSLSCINEHVAIESDGNVRGWVNGLHGIIAVR